MALIDKTLTAANCTFALSITSLYPVPQIIDQFSMDNPFGTDDLNIAETVLTLDGTLLGGFTPTTVKQTITIQPTADSAGMFINWIQASITSKSMYRANGIISLPDLGTKYVLTRGILVSGKVIPDAKKILQPITFKIEWERVVYTNI